MKVKDLSVKVTYRVGLGDVEMPKEVYDQMIEVSNNGEEINATLLKYNDAAEWLTDNIREGQCTEWLVEIEDIS